MGVLAAALIVASICWIAYRMATRGWLDFFRSETSSSTVTTEKIAPAFSKTLVEDKRRQDDIKEHDTTQYEEEDPEGSTTPKANATRPIQSVPLFNLHAAEQEDFSLKTDDSFQEPPAPNQPSLQTTPPTARMAPPPRPSTSLMPPPTVKPSALRPLPKLGGSLAPPPSAASSLRGPPRNTLSSLSVEASTSTLPPNKRPSRKVLLDPGHSPLDWANLTRNPPNPSFLRGKDVPPQLIKVTPSLLKRQNGRKGADAWGTYQGKVYNLTPYAKFHPGGVGELMRGAGKVGEAERLFIEVHPWVNWDGMLSECLVGILVSEDTAPAAKQKDLEAMD